MNCIHYFSNFFGSNFLNFLEDKTINYSGSSTREFGKSQETGISKLFLNILLFEKNFPVPKFKIRDGISY